MAELVNSEPQKNSTAINMGALGNALGKKKKKEKNSGIESLFIKFTKISVRDKLFFLQQLSIMVQTGISLAVALKTLRDQTSNKRFKFILTDLQNFVERGNLFSDGLQKYKNVFGELFINMIRAGESTGRLEEVLKQLFLQMKKDHDTVSKVKGAMIYPVVVLTAMVVISILIIVFVIPSLLSIFKEFGGKLPLPTRALIAISNFLTAYGIFVLIAAVVMVIAFIRIIRLPRGRFIFHATLLTMPILGAIIKKINLARFARTLSSLLKTDIAIITSFEITSKILGNELFRRSLLDAREKIQKGMKIHESLEPYQKLFPPVVLQMVSVGEETGSLDVILEQMAGFFEDEVDQTMKNLPTIIEPVLILVLGVGVALLSVAVILPIYSLADQI